MFANFQSQGGVYHNENAHHECLRLQNDSHTSRLFLADFRGGVNAWNKWPVAGGGRGAEVRIAGIRRLR